MSPDGLVVTLPAFAGIASPAQVSVVDPAAAPGSVPGHRSPSSSSPWR